MVVPVLSDGIASMVRGISEKTGSTTSFVHADRMGSMKALSASATVSDTADYDAFGKVISRTGSSATQKGFAGGFGYQEDGESGYKLLGHRYYDADSGRFLSRDPAFAGRNWYGYCHNNPLKAIDPSGLEEDTPGIFSLGLLRIVMGMPEPMRSRILGWLFGISVSSATLIIQKADEFLAGEGGDAEASAVEQSMVQIFNDAGVGIDRLKNISYRFDNSNFPFKGNGAEWSVRIDANGNRVTSIAKYGPQNQILDRLDLASWSGQKHHPFPHLHWYVWPGGFPSGEPYVVRGPGVVIDPPGWSRGL